MFEKLKGMTATQIIAEAKTPFQRVWSKCQRTDAEEAYNREAHYLNVMITNNKNIAQCNPFSFYTLLIDVAYHGLSIEPTTKPLSYVIPTPFNIGTKEKQNWQYRAIYTISPYGELELRVRSGIIKLAHNPVVVFKGDDFVATNDGIKHKRNFQSLMPIASYIQFQLSDGSWDSKVFDIKEIINFKEKSKDPKGDRWTGGEGGTPSIGMIEAKTIKHAFRSYGKIKLGVNTVLENDIDEDIEGEEEYMNAVSGTQLTTSNEQASNEQAKPATTELPTWGEPAPSATEAKTETPLNTNLYF